MYHMVYQCTYNVCTPLCHMSQLYVVMYVHLDAVRLYQMSQRGRNVPTALRGYAPKCPICPFFEH